MRLQDHATPQLADFSAAFAVVVAISLAATIWNARFAVDAGREISGHGAGAPEPDKAPATEVAESLDRVR